MATITCRVQYLEDSDPFVCTNFPEPRRPPQYDLNEHLPLNEQIAGVHKLLEAPLKVSEPHLPHKGVLLLNLPDKCQRIKLTILVINALCNAKLMWLMFVFIIIWKGLGSLY